MRRAVWILSFLVWSFAGVAGSCGAADVKAGADPEPEDYQLLREIISAEFAGQIPHEWGEAVSGVRTRLKTEDKVVALGVDTCDLMKSGQDKKLIKHLVAENIPATLFVCGDWVDRNGAALKKLAANPLFEIANQGLLQRACSVDRKTAGGIPATHSVEELFAEVEGNARKIEKITGILPQYYHAGSGHYDEVAVRIIKALGYEALGSPDAGSGGQRSSKMQVPDALANPSAGALLILRGVSFQDSFADAASEAVRKLRAKGYKFVKVSDYPLE